MADLAKDEKERTANIGIVSAVFGMGFLLGPVCGGLLSNISHSAPFWMAGGLRQSRGLRVLLPAGISPQAGRAAAPLVQSPAPPEARNRRSDPPSVLSYLADVRLAFVSGQSVFALFAKEVFGFSLFTRGWRLR